MNHDPYGAHVPPVPPCPAIVISFLSLTEEQELPTNYMAGTKTERSGWVALRISHKSKFLLKRKFEKSV